MTSKNKIKKIKINSKLFGKKINRTPLEEEEQEKVFSWVNEKMDKYPELALCHASLNGVKLSPGAAVKAKRQGMIKGIPDIFLPVMEPEDGVMSHPHHGLFIEMKRKMGGKVSAEQMITLDALNAQGFLAVVCHGADEAIETIKDYLNIKD